MPSHRNNRTATIIPLFIVDGISTSYEGGAKLIFTDATKHARANNDGIPQHREHISLLHRIQKLRAMFLYSSRPASRGRAYQMLGWILVESQMLSNEFFLRCRQILSVRMFIRIWVFHLGPTRFRTPFIFLVRGWNYLENPFFGLVGEFGPKDQRLLDPSAFCSCIRNCIPHLAQC